MQDIAGEVVMYSWGPLHMDEQRQDDQHEPAYSITEDLPKTMDDREVWRKRVRDNHADSATWWWWWWYVQGDWNVIP